LNSFELLIFRRGNEARACPPWAGGIVHRWRFADGIELTM